MPPVGQPPKLFTLNEANRTLPLVSRIVQDIVAIQRRLVESHREAEGLAAEGRTLRARELLERLQEMTSERDGFVEELGRLGCEIKDLDLGLVDFPARLGKRVVYLCWKLGEPEVAHWHELRAGFRGRKAVAGFFT
jgi:hypothetical protein